MHTSLAYKITQTISPFTFPTLYTRKISPKASTSVSTISSPPTLPIKPTPPRTNVFATAERYLIFPPSPPPPLPPPALQQASQGYAPVLLYRKIDIGSVAGGSVCVFVGVFVCGWGCVGVGRVAGGEGGGGGGGLLLWWCRRRRPRTMCSKG